MLLRISCLKNNRQLALAVFGWNEKGSLSLGFKVKGVESDSAVFNKIDIENFYIVNYAWLIYEQGGGDIYSESGIRLTDEECREIIIVAAASASFAVSVKPLR